MNNSSFQDSSKISVSVTQVLAAHADATLVPLPSAGAVAGAEPLRGDA